MFGGTGNSKAHCFGTMTIADPILASSLHAIGVRHQGCLLYTSYLYHNSVRNPCLALAKHFPETWQWPVLMLLQYSSAILLGAVVTRIVEWPLDVYKRQI